MARGWESKSVESQIEASRAQRKEHAGKPTTPEAAAALRERETLLLARTYLQQQILASPHPRHREMLQRALEDVDRKLAVMGDLDGSGDSR